MVGVGVDVVGFWLERRRQIDVYNRMCRIFRVTRKCATFSVY